MTRVAWKNFVANRRRLFGCFLAAFLGVAFLAGTLVLGDTLSRNFDQLFAQANANTDVVVRSATNIETGDRGPGTRERGLLPGSTVRRVAQVPGVASAQPQIVGYGQLLGADGKAVGGNGPPRQAGNWITDPALNPYHLVAGRAPVASDEVVVNQRAANDGHLHVGSRTIVQTPEPVPVTIVGIAKFGNDPGAGGTTFTAFTLAGAQQHVLGGREAVSMVIARAAPGVTQSTLTSRVQSVIPPGAQALTGAQYTREVTQDVTQTFLAALRVFLVIFAMIAVLVAAFSIYNTFSIVVAQRTRESGLLRAIGASRRNIMSSVIAEASIVGVAASLCGFAVGLGVAGLLKGLFDSFGFALPARGLVVTATAAAVSIIVGVVVTVGAAVAPALRASRIAPMAALRDADSEVGVVSRRRLVAAAVLLAAGFALAISGVVGAGSIARAGIGSVLVLAGAVGAGPLLARPVSRMLGAPAARLRGVAGSLGRENAMRNPRRTAATASALLVGVAIVTLFTVFAASLKAQINDTVSQTFAGDLVVNTPSFGGGRLSPQIVGAVQHVPQVADAAGVGPALTNIAGEATRATVTQPAQLAQLVDVHVTNGSLAALGPDDIAVSKRRADAHHWQVGSTVPVGFSDGTTVDAHVGAIYKETRLVGSVVMPEAMYQPHAVQPVDNMVLVKLRPGVSTSAAKSAVRDAVAPFGAPSVQDKQEYIQTEAQGANLMLGIVYALLALAILIAVMGIANTLSLAVHERTREVGLMRAVGETRRQVRAMVRWESVIVSVFGTVTGIGVGVFVAWALVKSASSGGFTAFAAPVGQLLAVVVLGGLVGVLAGWRPARRAARLDVLDAIAVS